MFTFFKMIHELIDEVFLPQERLASHLSPDRRLSYAPTYEFSVLLFRLSALSAELAQYPVCRKAGMGFFTASRCKIAGPLPVLRLFYHIGPDGIQNDIPADFEEMAVLLYQDGLVPALEQMADSAMALVEELRIDSVQLAHAEGKIAVRRFYKQMIMIGHEAICVTDPMIPFVDMLKSVQKILAVYVVLENGLLFVAARRHVIDCTGVFYAEWAGHEGTITKNGKMASK